MEEKIIVRYVEAAKRYAAADRTDPFTLDRCMCHIRTGIVGYTDKGEPAIYDAESCPEIRHASDGSTYPVIGWKNMVRP